MILAHGAGAGHRSPFIVQFASAIAALGIDTITFNFLYTEQRRRMPDRGPALEECYRAVIAAVRREVEGAEGGLFIGGKSMGGRIATQVTAADHALGVRGLVLLGYPLHPPGRRETRRDAHLPGIGLPMLIVQGTRDAFGTPDEITSSVATLAPPPTLYRVEGGDHSFKIPRQDPARQAAVYDDIQRTIVEWIGDVMASGDRRRA